MILKEKIMIIRILIEKLLSKNNGRMTEIEVCKILNITSQDASAVVDQYGHRVTWSRVFQANQTFDLISHSYKNDWDK